MKNIIRYVKNTDQLFKKNNYICNKWINSYSLSAA